MLNSDSNKIGNKIREQRKKLQITQSDLAESCDISTVYMSRIENGTANPSLDILLKLSTALHTSPDYFLSDTAYASVPYLNRQIAEKLQQCTASNLRIINKILDILLEEQSQTE